MDCRGGPTLTRVPRRLCSNNPLYLKPLRFANIVTTHTPLSDTGTLNLDLLEAQARVCTGPNQSRPLGVKDTDPDPRLIYHIVTDSLGLTDAGTEHASRAQIGAFLAAMTLRRTYPPSTRWSESETAAHAEALPLLETADAGIRLLIDPDLSVSFDNPIDGSLAGAIRPILHGQHLSYVQTMDALRAVTSVDGDPALKAGILIGQRMNHEDNEEFRAYLDAVVEPATIGTIDTPSLTTYGEPYTGSTRYFKPTVFVAAVRSSLGRPTLMHGVDSAPPKRGITEAQILEALGARVSLPTTQTAALLSDPDIGFAYAMQREFAPHAYRMLGVREHIKKRPTWAASEKAQQLMRSSGRNDMVIGFFHPGYEDKQLKSMRDRGLDAGCVIKGEEGTSQIGLRSGAPSESHRKTLNFVQGFQGDTTFTHDLDPAEFGFVYDQNPRLDEISAKSFAETGYGALSGTTGHIQDRIILNAGIVDWLLGYEPDPLQSVENARKAVLSGSALDHLTRYIAATRKQT
ncbi:TPA: hypothetical protein DCE37_03445 [Candidatus Latescibacteria bacterium]|nr:hypothetical protein [Candidatus Latescibacterota bacterium]